MIASKGYPAYQDYGSPYRTTDIIIEKAPDPAITLTTSKENLIGFSIGAAEDNTSIQIDWGDGTLVDHKYNQNFDTRYSHRNKNYQDLRGSLCYQRTVFGLL